VTAGGALESVRKLWTQLRQRGFELSPTDLDALRLALLAGFGWDSRDSFRELLVALWAKTPREAQALRALFERLNWPEGWTAPTPAVLISAPRVPRRGRSRPTPRSRASPALRRDCRRGRRRTCASPTLG